MSEVTITNVTKKYDQLNAVDRLSLQVEDREFLSLLGPSGCGKTTLLRMIAGLIKPDSGSIAIAGKPVDDIPPYDRNLAMVFQNYSLFPHMNVYENVYFGLKMRGLSRAEAEQRVGRALELVRLPGFQKRYRHELSGGQQQRVALARSIVYEPDVLLLDEPFGALDRKLREEMQIELKKIQRDIGITTIFVTHDQEEALILSRRIAVMSHGRLEQLDTPKGIYENPASTFVSDFIGVTNLFSGRFNHIRAEQVFITDDGLQIPWVQDSKPDGPAKISIRPENLQLHPPESKKERIIIGQVSERIYLGAYIRLYISFENGERLIAMQPARSTEGLNCSIGDRIGVTCAPENIVILGQ